MHTNSTPRKKKRPTLPETSERIESEDSSNISFSRLLPFKVTNVTPQNPEEFKGFEKIRKDELIWHVKDRSVPRSKMDLDFKLVAAYHCLKKAQQAHKKFRAAEKDIIYFMEMFEEFEENIEEVYEIELPNELEDIDQLRKEVEQMQKFITDFVI